MRGQIWATKETPMQATKTLELALSIWLLTLTACGAPLEPVWTPGEQQPATPSQYRGEIYPGPCSIEWDYGLDGSVDYRKTYIYAEDGQLLFEEWDRHADGTVDSRRRYAYDADGDLVAVEWDLDANGTIDSLTIDSLSDEAVAEATRYIDEEAAANGTRRYAYDREGKVRMEEYDPENDGVVNARAIYSYDESGNLVTKEWDADADGTVEWRGRYVYDCWAPSGG
jgi:hypothetical protein